MSADMLCDTPKGAWGLVSYHVGYALLAIQQSQGTRNGSLDKEGNIRAELVGHLFLIARRMREIRNEKVAKNISILLEEVIRTNLRSSASCRKLRQMQLDLENDEG